MKTTLDLPDDLMRAVKIRAAEHKLKLKDIVADALRAALASPPGAPTAPPDPVQAFGQRPVIGADGTVTNPAGLDDDDFFNTLDDIRESDRSDALRDPFQRG
jgi:hypothetical protein